jgi:cbb3-type cytochrome oxidase subunit 1/mono/diheme cytochrome c family protein
VTADLEAPEAPDLAPLEDDAGSRVVGVHLVVATLFLFVGLFAGGLAILQLVVPGLLDGIPPLTYGRLVPMATSALLYGWVTLGLLGGAYYVLPRLAMRSLRSAALALLSAAAIAVGVVAGMVAIGLGYNEGRPYLEMPLYADAVVVLGLILAAVVVTRNVSPRRHTMLPSHWYLLAASWLAVVTFVVGNVPGYAGFVGAMQTAFYRAAMTGFWFAAAGVGLMYYLVPRVVGAGQMRPSPLSALGFWSLAVVWGSTGPVMYIYGPGPGWYQTVGVAFAIALFVPVLVIVADFFVSMRGEWDQIEDRGALAFALTGSFFFLVVPVQMLVQALRTSSAVVQFTQFVPAADSLLVFGALSMWIFALAYWRRGSGAATSATAVWHLRLSVLGLAILLGAMWLGGVATGFTWAAGANAAQPTSFGGGWVETQNALDPYLILRTTGGAIFLLAQLLFVFGGRGGSREPAPIHDLDAEPNDLQIAGAPSTPTWRSLRYGSVALFAAAFLVTVFLPAFDPATRTSTILADRDRIYPEGSTLAQGRAVYLSEGCYYCHTQQVRPTVTDAWLGAVSVAGDYVHETPALLGVERLGPDLMHYGSRITSPFTVRQAVVSPRVAQPWSTMPSYDHLSDDDLAALVEYLMSLR